jgi:hypothetical protein
MTTVQIVGIAVAAAVVVLLVVALVVTRRRGGAAETPADGVSFLDSSPQDTFDGLGRADAPIEEVTLEPRAVRTLRDEPAIDPAAAVLRPAAAVPASEDTTGEFEPAGIPLSIEPVREETPGSDAPTSLERTGHRVPLADIIVTTSRKVVDLDDPEVRRMLKDLVKFEIDQATRYREQGQHIDAVLQLTEAEKISRALGMTESARAIRLMMRDLQE